MDVRRLPGRRSVQVDDFDRLFDDGAARDADERAIVQERRVQRDEGILVEARAAQVLLAPASRIRRPRPFGRLRTRHRYR